MINPIGLLVVHGIGYQRRGDQTREISGRLADVMIKEADPVNHITVQGVPVNVTEAYWAEISDPDNVLELRIGSRVLSHFLDTVSVAWYSLFSGFSSRILDISRAKFYFMLVGILAMLATIVIGLLV